MNIVFDRLIDGFYLFTILFFLDLFVVFGDDLLYVVGVKRGVSDRLPLYLFEDRYEADRYKGENKEGEGEGVQ